MLEWQRTERLDAVGVRRGGRTALHSAAGVGFCEGVRELLVSKVWP